MPTQNYFQRLEHALAQQRRSKGALASHLGVALSTVSRWREAIPKAETVQQTADWLGVDAKWLMTGADSENAESESKVKDNSGPDSENQRGDKDYTALLTRIADALEGLLEAVSRK